MAPCTTRRIIDHHSSVPDFRQYAGKADLTEVLVTGWRPLEDLTHSATVRWPRHHAFYTPSPRSHSLLLFAESVRQSLAVTSRLGLDIPMSHRMGWETLTCAVLPDALTVGASLSDMEVTITHEAVIRRKSGLARLTARVRATRDGMPLGTARVQYTAYPPALYDRLRGRYADATTAFARALPPGPAIDPALVGRTDPQHVTLTPDVAHGGTRRRWALRADTTHSVLFDHPHDHIPGMVLLEAASQAVQADAAPRRLVPVEFDTAFYRYVEFDLPCSIVADEATVDGRGRRHQTVSGLQGGEIAFTAQVISVTAGGPSFDRAPKRPSPHEYRPAPL